MTLGGTPTKKKSKTELGKLEQVRTFWVSDFGFSLYGAPSEVTSAPIFCKLLENYIIFTIKKLNVLFLKFTVHAGADELGLSFESKAAIQLKIAITKARKAE